MPEYQNIQIKIQKNQLYISRNSSNLWTECKPKNTDLELLYFVIEHLQNLCKSAQYERKNELSGINTNINRHLISADFNISYVDKINPTPHNLIVKTSELEVAQHRPMREACPLEKPIFDVRPNYGRFRNKRKDVQCVKDSRLIDLKGVFNVSLDKKIESTKKYKPIDKINDIKYRPTLQSIKGRNIAIESYIVNEKFSLKPTIKSAEDYNRILEEKVFEVLKYIQIPNYKENNKKVTNKFSVTSATQNGGKISRIDYTAEDDIREKAIKKSKERVKVRKSFALERNVETSGEMINQNRRKIIGNTRNIVRNLRIKEKTKKISQKVFYKIESEAENKNSNRIATALEKSECDFSIVENEEERNLKLNIGCEYESIIDTEAQSNFQYNVERKFDFIEGREAIDKYNGLAEYEYDKISITVSDNEDDSYLRSESNLMGKMK